MKSKGSGTLSNMIITLTDAYDNTTSLVILCVTIICIICIWKTNDPSQIVSNALSGLFGVATGRATARSK